MQPTLNPQPLVFRDLVLLRLIKSPLPESELQSLVGKIVVAERGDRRLIKRLIRLEKSNYCWLESDNHFQQFYDSNLFGPTPSETIKGKIYNDFIIRNLL